MAQGVLLSATTFPKRNNLDLELGVDLMEQKTRFIILLNNGYKYISNEKPVDDGITISFTDIKGLFRSFPKTKFEPQTEEVFV